MTKKTFLGAMAVALAVALTGSALIASNMGFKLNYTLSQGQAGVSADGTSTIALPDNRQTGLNSSKNLMDDIGSANVTNISRLLKATNTFQTYTGRKNSPGADFGLLAGEGYYVKMLTSVNYIIVGADDPTMAYSLQQGQAGVSADGTNFFAYNYHQTASTSKSLMDDIGSVNVTNISKLLKATNTFQTYTGRKNSPGGDFSLIPGEAYYVKMLTTVNYLPSHY
jgi:hypothetical protein